MTDATLIAADASLNSLIHNDPEEAEKEAVTQPDFFNTPVGLMGPPLPFSLPRMGPRVSQIAHWHVCRQLLMLSELFAVVECQGLRLPQGAPGGFRLLSACASHLCYNLTLLWCKMMGHRGDSVRKGFSENHPIEPPRDVFT